MVFEWDEDKAELNLAKHGVSFAEAQEALADPNAVIDFDRDHSTLEEQRFTLIGLSSRRLLFVVYTERGDVIRIIHARKASRQMKADYEEQNS